mgnify:FL=1|jgi:hypothetical protein
MAKNYNNTFIYTKFPYEENIFRFLVNANRIDKDTDKFEDIKYEFKKRQIDSCLLKVLMSKNVILCVSDTTPLNTQFRVICARDPKFKSNTDYKIFIDCTGLIIMDKDGNYKCRNIDILISHIVNAMTTMIYHKAENQVLSTQLISDTMEAFCNLFTHIIDYLAKISVIPSSKSKCQFLSCMYFTENIIQKEFNNNYQHIAGRITNLSEREQEMIMAQCDEKDFESIKSFVEKLADLIKVPALKVDNVIDKWMYLYGSNTVFAIEYYPALSAMLTDAYCGAYINNQKTIEKVVGNTLVSYTKNVIAKGGTLV